MLALWDQCTGCMACSSICERAIKVITDDEGFTRPFVVEEKCIECGMCTKICPVLNPVLLERLGKPLVFACANVDEVVRLQSASGGAFSAAAQSILQQKGIVFGAAMTDGLRVEHIAVEREDQLHLLRQSKYVQSDIGQCFLMAKKHLDNGRFVLFSGLPCQIAGLYSYLGRDYEKLYTVDILCKGAPSPSVFATFIHAIERRYKSDLRLYSFREKMQGSAKVVSVFTFADGKRRVTPLTQTSFGSGFSTDLFLRPSCYRCIYRNINRLGDISLGDYWGLGNDSSLYQHKQKGVSLVLLNSIKGKSLFESICGNLLFEERTIEEAVSHNSALKNKTTQNCNRARFFAVYKRYPHLALSVFTVIHRTVVWFRDKVKKHPKN
jgi:coenzyme F420-reducing hydrogenase beta subunit